MVRRLVAASVVLAAWSVAAACSDTVKGSGTGGDLRDAVAAEASDTSTASDSAVDVAIGSDAATDSSDGALDAPSDGNADADAPDCSNSPKLRDNTTTFFCPFTAPGQGNCANDATCCNPGKNGVGVFPTSFCGTGKDGNNTCAAEAAGHASSYTPGTSWECADKHACAGAEVCCLIQDPARLALDPANVLNIANTPPSDVKHPPACGVKRAYNEGGTRCRAACDAGDIQLCSLSDANCGAGTTCKPIIAGFRDVGYCK